MNRVAIQNMDTNTQINLKNKNIKNIKNNKKHKNNKNKHKSVNIVNAANIIRKFLPDDIVEFVYKKFKVYLADREKVVFYDNAPTEDRYIFLLDRGILTSVSSKIMSKKIRDSNSRDMNKVINVHGVPVLLCSKRILDTQGLDFFTETIPGYYNSLTDTVETLRSFLGAAKNVVQSIELKLVFADLIGLILNIRDGYFTTTKILTTMLSIFTIYTRIKVVKERMMPQSFGLSFNDLALFSVFGVSPALLDKLKTFMTITGKKITDCSALMEGISTFIGLLRTLLDEAIAAYPVLAVLNPFKKVLESILEYFLLNGKLKTVSDMYAKYVKNPQIMFEAIFRNEALELGISCESDQAFLNYIANTNNRYANIVWKAFLENVVKYAKTYDSTSRPEPICIVFDGPPGCGKTVLVNQLTQLLKQSKSIYVHTCPPVEGGKDFYDDYKNEDVMVMDDVGQQGISQWRTIINFVSPIKYPLSCAQADNKNTKFFNSKIIICTTNNFESLSSFTKSDCISTPEALFRRVHLVNVKRSADHDEFKQDLTYKKFDHVDEKRWKNEFIHENAKIDLVTSKNETEGDDTLIWLMSLIKSLETCRDSNASETLLSTERMERILNASRPKITGKFVDAQSSPWLNMLWTGFHGFKLVQEWMSNLSTFLTVACTAATAVSCIVKGDYMTALGVAISTSITIALGKYVYSSFFSQVASHTTPIELWKTTIEAWELGVKNFVTQGSICEDIPLHITQLSRHSRIIKFTNAEGRDMFTHGIVSGQHLILPSHDDLRGLYIDLYQSWDHYTNKHVEAEKVKVELVKEYLTCDIAVYKFIDFPPLYKKFKTLFKDSDTSNPFIYMIMGTKVIKMLKGIHVRNAPSFTSYASALNSYYMSPGSGFETPISAAGLCGSMLVDAAGVVIGMHTAGDDKGGYCTEPTKAIALEINALINNGPECEFEIDTKIVPNISGARLRYDEGEINKRYPIAKTMFVPTEFHGKYNEDVDNIMKEWSLRSKRPPIVKNPIAVIEEAAKKTFKPQGDISDAEEKYIEEVISTMIPEFGEISWDEVAFGNEDLPRINKDSSNGYGLLVGKTEYIDYENRKILDITYELLEDFRTKAHANEVPISFMLGVESIKDELRLMEKARDPRTFRVVPLTHMMWSKKILGNVSTHIKAHMHETGICAGFNPFKDMDVLARKLNESDVKCDADFKKWDGSLISRIMKIVGRVFKKKYRGDNEPVLQVLMENVYNSTALIYDAVWRTTHGMPSGTWLTFLLNCLYNKALTAIVLHRGGVTDPRAIYEVVDYVTGDDKICGASGKYAKIFNAFTIKDVAESLGMLCTNGDKSEILAPSVPFEKLNYLKRDFKYSKALDRWVGALSLETIMNTIQWRDKTKDANVVMRGKCQSMQIEAFLHGELVYSVFCKLIKKTAPQIMLFSRDKVLEILNDDEGYKITCGLAAKDISWC